MVDCGGTWCKSLGCITCYPNNNFESYPTYAWGDVYTPLDLGWEWDQENQQWINPHNKNQALIVDDNGECTFGEAIKRVDVEKEIDYAKKALDSEREQRDIAKEIQLNIEKEVERAKEFLYLLPQDGTAWYWDTKYHCFTNLEELSIPTTNNNTVWSAGVKEECNDEEVNHPSHYCNRDMEAIDIIEMIVAIEKNPKVAYNMSNVLKYLLRFRDKGTPVKDLKKASWYLNRMIEKLEKEVDNELD